MHLIMPKKHINNIELSYHTIGNGPPLVFIAGLGMDHMSWLYQIPHFQENYTVILLDNRGIGQSTGSDEQYYISMMADDVAALLEELHINKAHILGNSMGGMIAQEFALRHSTMVDKLILCSTFAKHPEMITYLKKGLTKLIKNNNAEKNDFEADLFSFKPVHSFLLQHVFSKDFLKFHEKMLTNTLQRFLAQDTYVETFLKQLHAIYHHDTLHRLSEINAETFVITGDEDALVPPICSETLTKHIPHAILHMEPGETHGFHIENPETFNNKILNFLKQQ